MLVSVIIGTLLMAFMRETLERWLTLAEERLRGKGLRLYVILGNDDEPVLHEVIAKIGKTICINPGSAYGEGVLHGALFELDKRKGLKRYQLTSG
jgi:Icc-related predicted phosphoesterase